MAFYPCRSALSFFFPLVCIFYPATFFTSLVCLCRLPRYSFNEFFEFITQKDAFLRRKSKTLMQFSSFSLYLFTFSPTSSCFIFLQEQLRRHPQPPLPPKPTKYFLIYILHPCLINLPWFWYAVCLPGFGADNIEWKLQRPKHKIQLLYVHGVLSICI